MTKQTRSYEEIITLQDKAIEALTQANAALVLALETLKKARAEHGFAVQLPGIHGFGLGHASGGFVNGGSVGGNAIGQYIHTTPAAPQWTMNVSDATMADKAATASNITTAAQTQKTLAEEYITAYQDYQKHLEKDSDAVSKVGIGSL